MKKEKRFKKEGLSMIITVLVVLSIAFIAIFSVWAVVKNLIIGGTEEISLKKTILDLKIENVDINIPSNEIIITLKRNPGKGELPGINFIISDEEKSEEFKQYITLGELESKTFIIRPDNLLISKIKTLSIAPIFKLDSGREIVSDIADKHNLNVELIETNAIRKFSDNNPSPNDVITVDISVSIIGGVKFYVMEEYVPEDFVIIGGGGSTSNPSVLKWAVIQNAENATYEYTIRVPNKKGDYYFDGIYEFKNSGPRTTLGESKVVVE